MKDIDVPSSDIHIELQKLSDLLKADMRYQQSSNIFSSTLHSMRRKFSTSTNSFHDLTGDEVRKVCNDSPLFERPVCSTPTLCTQLHTRLKKISDASKSHINEKDTSRSTTTALQESTYSSTSTFSCGSFINITQSLEKENFYSISLLPVSLKELSDISKAEIRDGPESRTCILLKSLKEISDMSKAEIRGGSMPFPKNMLVKMREWVS